MNNIPFDIIINNIIPYTYNPQPKKLLEDIRNYYTIRSKLIKDIYRTNIIKHEIMAKYYLNKQKFDDILSRHRLSNTKKLDHSIILKYSQDTKFNIIFGLLTEDERKDSLEYIFEHFSRWIIKTP
jgi:hypothetical protein